MSADIPDRIDPEAAETWDYVPDAIPDLPEDDTEPDEHGNEPRECVRCMREPAITDPVITTSRGIDAVNGRYWIDPVCNGHKPDDMYRTVWDLLEYDGVQFLAEAILAGVLDRETAFEKVLTGPPEDVDNGEQTPAQIRDELLAVLEES